MLETAAAEYIEYYRKLDAVQSQTLTRPAAPLAACIQQISRVDNTTGINTYSV